MSISVSRLRVESLVEPAGLDEPRPRFSWVLSGRGRGLRQTSRRILAATSRALLDRGIGDAWDGGLVETPECLHVPWDGRPLRTGEKIWWKVQVGAASLESETIETTWSEASSFSMGILTTEEWTAPFIRAPLPRREEGESPSSDEQESPSPWFRRLFALEEVPEVAWIHAEAMGYFELWVNGAKVGTDVLSLAVSILKKRTWVRTFDVAPLLSRGQNVLGVWMGRGWHTETMPGVEEEGPLLRIQSSLVAKGESRPLGTDLDWEWKPSPYVTLGPWKWNRFGGERYDARLEDPAWCLPSKADFKKEWSPVERAKEIPSRPSAQPCKGNRIGASLSALGCLALGPGLHEFDFGKNLTGWVRLDLPALPVGTRLRLHYADRKYASVDPQAERTQAGVIPSSQSDRIFEGDAGSVRYQTFHQLDEFIAGGKEGESFCSKFNYHGFRYLIVEGLPENPGPAGAHALLIESDVDASGEFACSDDRLNRLHQTNLWTLRCLDLGGYLVDCPHRERLGYGDGQVSLEGGAMSLDFEALLRKWLVDWTDVQTATGALSFATPYHPPAGPEDFGREGPIAWGGLLVVLAWKSWLLYGDAKTLELAFPKALRFLERMEGHFDRGLLRGYGDPWQRLGDWVPPDRGMDTDRWPDERENELFNNCYFLYLLELVEKMARVLGSPDEARRCASRREELRPRIHREFWDESLGLYLKNEQVCQLMPLVTGVVPESLREGLHASLMASVDPRRGGRLGTGMLGTVFLMDWLLSTGEHEVAAALHVHAEYPGWGYMIAEGSSTLWEQWNGYWSRIHSCFTSASNWLIQGLGGLRVAPPSVEGAEVLSAFRVSAIRPSFAEDVSWVRCRHETPYGTLACEWSREEDGLEVRVRVPANTTSLLRLPSTGPIEESGRSLSLAKGVAVEETRGGETTLRLQSGRYRFHVTKG